ncbi:hypothetical protein BK011_07100 [Tenericutes bacterium MZ-XQ]|jgi:HAD superfamily hydrolase (TIGR01549 family)|nr:hypothetical protein BK011_07100 [Tenericutes bacterium MZ-XQ]
MKKIVIFDLDGTLSNNVNQSEIIYQRISERYNMKKLSKEEIRELKTNPGLKRLFELGIPIHKLPKMYKESREIASDFVDECSLIPGMKELLINLNDKKIKLAIVSSNSVSNINKILANNEISIFSFIEGKAKMKGKKRKIKKLLKKSGYKTNDAIYIGDEVRDVLACQSIPLEVAAVTWGFETKTKLEESNPNYIVESIDELSQLLLN